MNRRDIFRAKSASLSGPQASATGKDFRCEIVAEDESEIILAIRGVVGDGELQNDHGSIAEVLERNPKANVVLKVNSPGGSAYDGVAIANALMSHEGQVTAIIEGLAFSAASFLILTADKVKAYKTSSFGIHRAWVMTVGNKNAMLATADDLSIVDDLQIELFMSKTGLAREEVEVLIDGKANDGTMFSAEKALELGFIDEIISRKEEEDDEEDAQAAGKSLPMAYKKDDEKVEEEEEEEDEEEEEVRSEDSPEKEEEEEDEDEEEDEEGVPAAVKVQRIRLRRSL
jgi:ATP-dependent Clp protease, protease subunit